MAHRASSRSGRDKPWSMGIRRGLAPVMETPAISVKSQSVSKAMGHTIDDEAVDLGWFGMIWEYPENSIFLENEMIWEHTLQLWEDIHAYSALPKILWVNDSLTFMGGWTPCTTIYGWRPWLLKGGKQVTTRGIYCNRFFSNQLEKKIHVSVHLSNRHSGTLVIQSCKIHQKYIVNYVCINIIDYNIINIIESNIIIIIYYNIFCVFWDVSTCFHDGHVPCQVHI